LEKKRCVHHTKLGRSCRFRVNRDRVEPAAFPVMSAMPPIATEMSGPETSLMSNCFPDSLSGLSERRFGLGLASSPAVGSWLAVGWLLVLAGCWFWPGLFGSWLAHHRLLVLAGRVFRPPLRWPTCPPTLPEPLPPP
jgi:hypothetical protein